ncbi:MULTISPECIES: restriction endonuclease subunit S [Thermodesulfobacteriota]|jgi:type I restriction enzyme S subunit|uniref:Type I restriction enzyme, S subunit n=1 Tax=Desulfofustis glycolicus DSM 9705 TaxID=1121409 RepID=A0A1M5XHZ0_9BACT|nr:MULTISPECIES: restriction endonuclease subunit S [Thermodesulfobacteriota]SHH99134.1 type I restriction enzyme, S subunit [Desulfofustis glycolicus DSM 9705]
MKLAPYPEYKDAVVSWVGSIPAHWPEKRAKYYFKEIDDRSLTGDEEMLSVSHITGVTPRSQKNVTMFKAESNVGQKRCQPGDLIINTMWAWMSALGVSNHAGIVSPAYGVYRPRSNQDYDYYYLDSLLRIEGYRSEYICRSTGIRSSRLRLYPDKFLSMPVVCPPQEEQQAIARFLKAQDRLFRKFIRNKRRFIELLKEQKQNVINQAVTRGLDPKVKFKPSGVEWIGDIPEHWDATKLKRVVSFNPSKSETRANPADEEKVVFLPMENISVNGDIDCSEKRTLSEVWNGFTYFRRGDVVVAKITPCFENGKGAYLKGLESDFGFGTTELIVLRPSKAIDGAFLRFLTSTKQFLLLGEQYMTGAAGQQRIPSDFVKNYPIGLPPIKEQREILEHIQEKSAEIDQAITRAQREIELMREYRTRLISDVVTGQVDVRGIEVPEVADEELLALEEDTADADDVIDDEGEMDETD